MMEHRTKSGESKIVADCSYPLTGMGCVRRLNTDLAVLEVTPDGVKVLDCVEGLSFEDLQAATAVRLLR